MNEIQALIDAEFSAGRRGLDISGPYQIDAPFTMPPGFTLASPFRDAVITAAPGVPMTTMVDFATRLGAGSRITGVTFDGSRSTRPNGFGIFAALIYDTNDVSLDNCKFLNLPGAGAFVRDGKRPKFKNNRVDNVWLCAIGIQGSSPGNSRSDAEISGNDISNYGMHAIQVVYGNNSEVSKNKITSMLVRSGLNMAFNGSLYASSLSGGYFSKASEGRFLIASGWERLITAYISPTQVQMDLPLGPIIMAPSGWCNGDIISIQGSSNCTVEGNTLEGGGHLGVSVFSDTQASADRNNVVNNRIYGVGSAAISLQNQEGPFYVRDTLIAGNEIVDAAMLGAAGARMFNVGIAIQNNHTFGVRCFGNNITGYSKTMEYPISINKACTVNTREVFGNMSRGCIRDWVDYNGL